MEQKGDVKVLVATCRAQLSFLHDKTNECGSNSLHWFQKFCVSLTDLIRCYTKYSKDLNGHCACRESLLLYVTHLKEILNLSIETFIAEDQSKLPLTEARNFIAKQLNWCFDGLSEVFDNPSENENEESFIRWMDLALEKLLELNFSEERENVINVLNECRLAIEEVLSQAMSIAQVATEHYNVIKGSCQSVLEGLQSLDKELAKDSWNVAMCGLFVDVCNDKLCILERRVNTTVLKLCLSVFSVYKNSLEHLHAFCLSDKEKTETEIDDLVAEFDLHVDRLMQIGFFAIACSTDTSRVTLIKSCIVSLEALEIELVPALTAQILDRSVENVQYATVLKNFWLKQTIALHNTVYYIIDPTAFSGVIFEDVKSNVEEIQAVVLETRKLSKIDIHPVIIKAEILIDFLHFSSEEMTAEELERVKPKLEKVKIALHELRAAVELLLADICSDEHTQKRLIKRCKILCNMIKQLWESTNEEKSDSTVTGKNDTYTKFLGNPLIHHIIERGQEILKDRSILNPSKNASTTRRMFLCQKGAKKETPLLKLVLQKRMNFTNSRMKNHSFNQTLTGVLNDISNLTRSTSEA